LVGLEVIWRRNDFLFKQNKTLANDVVHLILQQVEDTKQASRMSNSIEPEIAGEILLTLLGFHHMRIGLKLIVMALWCSAVWS
jgi:hypothetical protein